MRGIETSAHRIIAVLRKPLLTAAVLVFAWAIVASITGGIDTRLFGVLVRARGASRPMTIGFVLLLIYAVLNRDEFDSAIATVTRALRTSAPVLGLLLSVALAAHAIRFGSFTAGGSDSYAYVSGAYGWARGELPKPIPLPLSLPFPTSDPMQTPLGYRNGVDEHTMVPIVAPGLPLLMAAALLVGGACGPFLVTAICAALLVWSTFLVGRRAAGPIAGAIAATVVTISPAVLYQAIAPMSDIPAAGLWTAALAASLAGRRRHAAMAGACTAVALLIRPNVLPLALVPCVAVALHQHGRERWIRLLVFLAPLVPVPLLIGVVNTIWYGSPRNSGYGSLGDVYALANVWPNLRLYTSWFWASHSPWALVGLVSLLPMVRRRPGIDAPVIRIAALMTLLTLACYLAYQRFDVWWFLRFLLPAAGAAATLVAVGSITLARALPRPWGWFAAVATLWMLVTSTVPFASREGVFGGIQALERRYVDAGEFVARRLPSNAVVLAMQHSGSARFYGGRMTLRLDFIEKEWAARVPAELERAGLHPYMLIDDWEIADVRLRFSLPPAAALPWPAVARMRQPALTILDLATSPVAAPVEAIEPGSARHWCGAPAARLSMR